MFKWHQVTRRNAESQLGKVEKRNYKGLLLWACSTCIQEVMYEALLSEMVSHLVKEFAGSALLTLASLAALAQC